MFREWLVSENGIVSGYMFVTLCLAVLGAWVFHEAGTGGIWAWGIVSSSLGFAAVVLIGFGYPPGVYERFKASASAIGAVIAASVLAWSWFFQYDEKHSPKAHSAAIEKVSDKVSEVENDLAFLKGLSTKGEANALAEISRRLIQIEQKLEAAANAPKPE